MGRGVVVFSSSRAMALASKMPTQMGRTMIAGDVFEHDDGHVGDGVHHEAANLHLDFVGFVGDGMSGGLGHLV